MQFLEYFTYERTECVKGEKVFYNCTFLKDMLENGAIYHIGDKVPSIRIALTFYIWNEAGDLQDELFETL